MLRHTWYTHILCYNVIPYNIITYYLYIILYIYIYTMLYIILYYIILSYFYIILSDITGGHGLMDPVKVNLYAINTEKNHPQNIILSYIILCCVIFSYLILYCISIFLCDRTQLQLLMWTFLSPPSFWFEDFIHLHTSSYIFIRMSCAESISVNGRLDSMGVGSVGKHFLWIPWYPQKAGGPQPFKTVCLCEKVVVVARTADSAAGVSWRHSLWIAFASLKTPAKEQGKHDLLVFVRENLHVKFSPRSDWASLPSLPKKLRSAAPQ